MNRTFSLNGKTVLFEPIKYPDADQCRIETTTTSKTGEKRDWFCYYTERSAVTVSADLPGTGWQFLCLSKDITEEQAAQIMETCVKGMCYKNYSGVRCTDSGMSSFRSFLSANSLEGNYAVLVKQQ